MGSWVHLHLMSRLLLWLRTVFAPVVRWDIPAGFDRPSWPCDREWTGKVPVRSHAGDAGFDLFVSRTTVIEPHSWADVPHDIEATYPPHVWVRITGRSSTLRKMGLLVQEGIIDSGYQGPLFTCAYNPSDVAITVLAGSRISQAIPQAVLPVRWVFQSRGTWPQTDRGTRGFGSTG